MRRIIAAGHSPYNPALTCFADYPDVRTPQVVTLGVDYDQWLRVSGAWVGACDAVLRVPGESVGADREVESARALGGAGVLLPDRPAGAPWERLIPSRGAPAVAVCAAHDRVAGDLAA